VVSFLIIPARTISLWLTTSASDGSSFRVGIKSLVILMGCFTSDGANLRKAFTTVTYALHLDQGRFSLSSPRI
jgi:hypothetical protein